MSTSLQTHFPQRSQTGSNRAFVLIFVIVLLVVGSAAIYLSAMSLPESQLPEKQRVINTRFIMTEQREEEKPKKEKPPEKKEPEETKPEPKKKKKEVVDLTKKPELNAEKKSEPQKKDQPEKVRRVYGVKKVYSHGMGSGGSRADGVVGKRGNTLEKSFDTITATEDDLKGELVAAVTVTQAPSFKKRVVPKPTEAMKKNGVEGLIKVKVLVDIDGRVKRAVAQNDLGFGSKEAAVKACLDMRFNPAMRGNDPVAVWITVPVRFKLLNS
ncbi:MAG: energy transducer TonB [Fibrobacterota bacterium]